MKKKYRVKSERRTKSNLLSRLLFSTTVPNIFAFVARANVPRARQPSNNTRRTAASIALLNLLRSSCSFILVRDGIVRRRESVQYDIVLRYPQKQGERFTFGENGTCPKEK